MPRGRDILLDAMQAQGISFLFGNPGTTELPVVDGCCVQRNIRYVMALHEDISVAMAMGYARVTGKVGVVNLHVAPGLAHGLGNLYNAWQARIPLLVTTGQQHSRFLLHEPSLSANLPELARPFTKWAAEVAHVDNLALAVQRAFKVALTPPAGPVFLSLPLDVTLAETTATVSTVTRIGVGIRGDPAEIERMARLLTSAQKPLIVAGDGVGLADAWPEITALAERLGARVYSESLSTLCNFPPDHAHWAGSLSWSQAAIHDALAAGDVVLLCGFSSQAPVTGFAAGKPVVPPEVKLVYLHNDPWEIGKNYAGDVAVLSDVKLGLADLLAALGPAAPHETAALAHRRAAVQAESARRRDAWQAQVDADRHRQPITAVRVAAELARLLPENAIVCNEAVSNSAPFSQLISYRDPLGYWHGRGGSLGHALGAAMGMKAGAPERSLVAISGDGALLYYPQALWTAAHAGLPVLFIVLNNKSYHILKQGLKAMGGPWGTPATDPPGLDIDTPAVDFIAMAAALGVRGEQVRHPSELAPALSRGLNAGSPWVVEVLVDASM